MELITGPAIVYVPAPDEAVYPAHRQGVDDVLTILLPAQDADGPRVAVLPVPLAVSPHRVDLDEPLHLRIVPEGPRNPHCRVRREVGNDEGAHLSRHPVQLGKLSINGVVGTEYWALRGRVIHVSVAPLHAGPLQPNKGDEPSGLVGVVGHVHEVFPLSVGQALGVIRQGEYVEKGFLSREGVQLLGTSEPVAEVGLAVDVAPVKPLHHFLFGNFDGIAWSLYSGLRIPHMD